MGAQIPVGAGLGAFWQASQAGSPAERPLGPGPSRTHPEPALALVGAVVHLDLPQGNGVDDPVDQLLADLLCGALQRQCPAAGQGCQGLPGCGAAGMGDTPVSPSVPGRGKGGWPQGPPVQNGTESQLEGWGLPPAPASSPRQPRRLWARRTHQGSNRSLPRPWPPPTPRREQLLVISQVSTRQRRELGGTTRPRAQPCGQINGRPGSQGPDSANCPSGAVVPPRGPPPQPTPALESAPQLCGKCGRP